MTKSAVLPAARCAFLAQIPTQALILFHFFDVEGFVLPGWGFAPSAPTTTVRITTATRRNWRLRRRIVR
ncbi:hypothetical protein DFJ73DRAFT_875172, partial [Zopfochytrium polystomum]